MKGRFVRVARVASVALLGGASACLPIPNRVTDAVQVAGVLTRGGRPLPGVRLSVEQPRYVGPGRPDRCSGAAPVVSDSSGRFYSPRRRKWQAWVFLLGESPEWHIPTRLCVEQSGAWEELFLTHANGWDPPLQLTCDVAGVPATDSLTGTRGRCVPTGAAAQIPLR